MPSETPLHARHRFSGLAGTALAAYCLAAAIALMLAMPGSAFAESSFSFDTTPGKLPKTVVPVHYAIELTPDLQQLTLAASEQGDIEVREPTARLTLNALDMTLDNAVSDDGTQCAEIPLDTA